uniref:Peptidase S1 domain-containing protein n=1 Tax=Anopheles dirus TaxID=7168 RepID=A0A182NCN2_9DIPT
LDVVLGGIDLFWETQRIPIRRIVIHPKYNSSSFKNDIALMELSVPANTTNPLIRPICLPVTPELRPVDFANLKVTVFVPMRVNYVNETECRAKYAKVAQNVFLDEKQFCAQTLEEDSKYCTALTSGVPLNQVQTFGVHERYFLRGFDLYMQSCNATVPSIYIDVNEYLDWILYNMKYCGADDEGSNGASLEADWGSLQQQQGNEKLTLFNMTDCGLAEPFDQTSNRYPNMPWIGWLHTHPGVTVADLKDDSLAVLINRRYALAAAAIMQNKSQWRFITLGSLGNYFACRNDRCERYTQEMDVRGITVHPSFTKHPRQHDIALIEFWQSPDPKNRYIRPICLPFTESMRHGAPLALIVSTINLFFTENRQLQQLTVASCQQQFAQNGRTVKREDISLCAALADVERQSRVSIVPGAPLQAMLQFGGHKRHFLRGLNYAPNRTVSAYENLNVYLPYLFTDIHPYLDWMLDSMSVKPRQNLLGGSGNLLAPLEEHYLGTAQDLRLPIRNAAKRRLFNFKNCGTDVPHSLSSSEHGGVNVTHQWFGGTSSDFPYGECVVTLISEWYLLGSASCLKNYSKPIILRMQAHDPSQSFPIQRIILHPQYQRGDLDNNIALVQLAKPVNSNRTHFKPVCLPITGQLRTSSYNTSHLVTVGTLSDTHRGKGFDSRTVGATVGDRWVDISYCQKRWKRMTGRRSSASCIYSLPLSDGEYYEQLDGAPIYSVESFNNIDRHFLRGIALTGVAFYDVPAPIYFLEIDSYLDWILDSMDETLHLRELSYSLNEKLVFS